MTDDESASTSGLPVPDTGMATGSEDGDPGDLGDATPLRPDEQSLLTELERPDGPPAAAVEDSPEAVAAVGADSVLPGLAGGPADDPLTPDFRAP